MTLTPAQQLFIKEHYLLFTHKQMADEMKVKVGAVTWYCWKEGLRKVKSKKVK